MRGPGRRRLALCLGDATCRDEGGFSLAETLVALGIAVVSLLAMLGTGVFALRSSVEGRLNQLAGDLVNGAVEQVRSLEYRNVAMRQTDLTATTDPAVNKAVTPHTFDPGTGAERLWTETNGSVNPYRNDDVSSRGTFTIRRYVTVPVTCTVPATVSPCAVYNVHGQPSIKRLTVVVTWRHFDKPHERRVGTLLTNTKRGLPLPDYTWNYNGPAPIISGVPTWAKNPGNAVDYGFVLVNKGATDSWKLTTDPTTPAWEWYHDINQNGVYDTGETSLGNAASGYVTGSIQAGSAPFYVVAHRVIGSLETLGTSTTNFSATSVAQPSYPAKTVTTSLTITSGVVALPSATASATASPEPVVCTPGTDTTSATGGVRPIATTQSQYTITDLSLYNGPTPGDTPTQGSNVMGTDPGLLQPSPCNFSTDVQTDQAGRRLGDTGYAQWLFQPGSAAQDEFRGTAVFSIWVQCPSGTPTLKVEMGTYSTGTTNFVRETSASVSAPGCPAAPAEFHRVDFSLTTSANGFAVAAGTTLRLAIRVSTNQPVRLLYGVSPMPARLTVGLK